MIVDGHLHVFLPHSQEYPRVVDELAPPGRAAPVEELLPTLDAAGVDRAVLVPLGPEDDYLAECLRAHPDRFAGVIVADQSPSRNSQGTTGREPGTDPAARLLQRLEHTGAGGLRMNWLGPPDRPVTASPAFGVLETLARQGLVLWFYAPPEQLTLLDEALQALPGLRVVLNHLGFCPTGMTVDDHARPRIDTPLPPPTHPRVQALARHPGVRVMLSGEYAFSRRGHPYPDLTPVVRSLRDTFGADRMLWASDFPWTVSEPGYRRLLELPDHHLPDLTGPERAAILGGTALELFHWTT